MASGPQVLSGNRFRLLDQPTDSPKRKKKKTSYSPIDLNINLPSHSTNPNPKFIVVSPADTSKPLTSFSIFLVKKAIDSISTSYEYITQLRDGNLLILVKSQKIADIFLSKKWLSNLCPIVVSLHSHLNSSKGTVYAPCLINVPEQEIVSEMKDQGVTQVYKFVKKEKRKKDEIKDGEEELVEKVTGLVLFTFDRFRPPSSVNVGWYTLQVEEYFPNPMRCKTCQLLGHTSKRCNRNPSCDICNLPPHSPENCKRTSCANCTEEHPASSKLCKRYLQEREILKIKTINKCSMGEARKIYAEQNPIPSSSLEYSSVVKNSSKSISSPQTLNSKDDRAPPPIANNSITPNSPKLVSQANTINQASISLTPKLTNPMIPSSSSSTPSTSNKHNLKPSHFNSNTNSTQKPTKTNQNPMETNSIAPKPFLTNSQTHLPQTENNNSKTTTSNSKPLTNNTHSNKLQSDILMPTELSYEYHDNISENDEEI